MLGACVSEMKITKYLTKLERKHIMQQNRLQGFGEGSALRDANYAQGSTEIYFNTQ